MSRLRALYPIGFLTLTIALSWSALTVANALQEIPMRAERQIALQGKQLQAQTAGQATELLRQVNLLRLDVRALGSSSLALVDKRAESLQTEVLGRVDVAIAKLDTQVTAARGSIDGQVETARKSIDAQLGRTNDSLARIAAVAEPVQSSAQQVSDALPLFLDCDHNADCLFNRYVGTARAIEKGSTAVAAAAPGIGSSADRIAANFATLTDAMTEKKPWYKHLSDVLFSAARIGVAFR